MKNEGSNFLIKRTNLVPMVYQYYFDTNWLETKFSLKLKPKVCFLLKNLYYNYKGQNYEKI